MNRDSVRYRSQPPESRQSIPGVFCPHPLFLTNILSIYVRLRSCSCMRCALCVQYSVITLLLRRWVGTLKCPSVQDVCRFWYQDNTGKQRNPVTTRPTEFLPVDIIFIIRTLPFWCTTNPPTTALVPHPTYRQFERLRAHRPHPSILAFECRTSRGS